ncbi:hypothetical protein SISNIDRAFT_468210 [Sistotremastrum niveocremeum HHB9708]|uniref:Uncharacterized protein n=1 Tax=Sistotremastrum niveocremeum HHB9708 TaxID=1314777 RepID=A0A164RXL1_9AGAM|nr:hypothetical protein SISNIDRAFT_468210 [Sistotremastrum niveocremeum HHB9708]
MTSRDHGRDRYSGKTLKGPQIGCSEGNVVGRQLVVTGHLMTGCRTATAVAVASHSKFGIWQPVAVASHEEFWKKSSRDWTLELYLHESKGGFPDGRLGIRKLDGGRLARRIHGKGETPRRKKSGRFESFPRAGRKFSERIVWLEDYSTALYEMLVNRSFVGWELERIEMMARSRYLTHRVAWDRARLTQRREDGFWRGGLRTLVENVFHVEKAVTIQGTR